MNQTSEEKNLLAKLLSGVLDGFVGNNIVTSGGSTVWAMIKNGVPVRYKQGPGGRIFNGKENERIAAFYIPFENGSLMRKNSSFCDSLAG